MFREDPPTPTPRVTPHDVQQYVARHIARPELAARVVRVLAALPEAVTADFLRDPAFRIAEDDYVPGRGRVVHMAPPAGRGNGSRSVVLKASLADRPTPFAHYIIAHEFAHAHLRNGGWRDIADPEHAADALAAHWGFPRPS